MQIAWAGLHLGEEPPLTGKRGSGTIFFTGCTLKCGFCQNHQISRLGLGAEVSPRRLAALMLELQAAGAVNINLVTPTHFTPGIVESLRRAREGGLSVPVVWNTSGYEKLSTLSLANQHVDVYLADCKTLDEGLSRRLMAAGDYPQVVREALPAMAEAKALEMEGTLIRQGVIMRHLVLPGYLEASRSVLEWFSDNIKGRALLSLMFQYIPPQLIRSQECKEGETAAVSQTQESGQRGMAARSRAAPSRRINRREVGLVLSWLEELGIEDGFVQDPDRSSDWLPDFRRRNPFPEAQAQPLWHFTAGRAEAPGKKIDQSGPTTVPSNSRS